MQDPASLSKDQLVLLELVLSLEPSQQSQVKELAQQLFAARTSAFYTPCELH
jgi:hypothetical protein